MNFSQMGNSSLESILVGFSLLLTLSVLSSRISSKYGVPSLLFFLVIGMLSGSEGPGGIAFDNYRLSFAIGSVCLALIIFDGGLRTSWKSVKPILPLGVSLSLVGTVATGVLTGIFTHYAIGLDWTQGLLLGAIVSSTDAAAVFSILRARSLSLKGALKQTLEFEAGSNDPIAVFLTVGVLTYATSDHPTVWDFLLLFFSQAGIGLLMGSAGGKAVTWIMNHAGIEYEGLYSVLLLGLVLLLFGMTSVSGGSGFLAVYVAGLIVGNSEFSHKGSIVRFHDGIAWIAQIIVFLTLGLLSFPSHLLAVWKEGLLLSLFMMFIVRPLSVLIAAPGKILPKRERIFVSWVGLRGVAPIILATLPWSVNFPQAEYYFNLVFFVVMVSVIVQGVTIPWVAKKVGVAVPFDTEPPNESFLEFLPAGFVSVDVFVKPSATAENKRIVELSIPSGVLFTSLERAGRYLIPHGGTIIRSGDRIRALARPSNLVALERLFGEARPTSQL